MWHVDLKTRTAEHDSGYKILSEGSDKWTVLEGDDEALFEQGRLWYLHEYSKNYINFLMKEKGLSLSEISNITQKEIDENPNDDWGYKHITESDLIELLSDREPLFPIELCSLIRKAAYFQLK